MLVLPAASVNVPAGHGVHSLPPGVLLPYVLTGQMVQSVVPHLYPAGHCEHEMQYGLTP